MFAPKATGAFLAGQALGKSAGKIAAENKFGERLDIQSMALADLRQRLGAEIGLKKAAMIGRGFELCVRVGLNKILSAIGRESTLIAEHLAKYGSLTQTEFEELAPITAERRKGKFLERVESNRISRDAALAYLDSDIGKNSINDAMFNLDPEERARILERVRAEIEEFYKTE